MKEAKKAALKELEGLKKEIEGIKTLDQLENHISHLPLFHRIIYKSRGSGILEAYYGHMTLKFLLKSGIIELSEKVEVWGEDGIGYIGTFTPKTLKMECDSGKELD